MPVTTRSQARLLLSAQGVESQLAPKLSKTQQSVKTTKPAAIHDGNPPQDSGNDKPALDSPPVFSTETSWSCLKCSCQKGVFANLVDSCVQCAHSMDDHAPHQHDPWNPGVDYVCNREELVTTVLQRARHYGVVVIRATPQVGKTTLLKLLGHRIAHQESDLEPVNFIWQKNERRNFRSHWGYLELERDAWRGMNAKIRPYNPAARVVYLIDEAQDSYDDEAFWSMLKNHHITRSQPLFVLVCLYGAAGVSHIQDPSIESQALLMHSMHRIELRAMHGGPRMLFRREELSFIIQNFATVNGYQLEDGVIEYLYSATDGHPGMVGLLLSHLTHTLYGKDRPRTLSPNFFHNLIVEDEYSFIYYLTRWGRGFWIPRSEEYVKDRLELAKYSHLVLPDIKKALREVAEHPDGLTLSEKKDDAFAFCHKMGYLHTEQPVQGSKETKFTFASPLHRRVAHRRLISRPERDAINNLSLKETCTNAIARFSPGALCNRRGARSNRGWRIPEAAFQFELYCCLNLELRCLPILSEYSHTSDGRIDFYVSDKKWGIELLQCGSTREIAEHIARFASDGRYQDWGIMDDYIILNFCPRSSLRKARIDDEKIRSHFFHVVIEPNQFAAEIYTHDKQLLQSLSLGEGRQRANAYDFLGSNNQLPDTEDRLSPPPNGTTPGEQATAEGMKKLRQEMQRKEEEMQLQMQREREEIRLQMQGEREEIRLQMQREREEIRLQMQREREEMRLQREKDHGEPVQAQDKSVSVRGGRKRKR